jgi:hypothetical protein
MDMPSQVNPGQFSPETAWNKSQGAPQIMADILRRALIIPGNFLWGDATAAALVEISEGVNIILLAVDTGVRIPPTSKELVMARTIFGRWVERMFDSNPHLQHQTKEEVLATLTSLGLTWSRALSMARSEDPQGQPGWLKGRRQPVGTVNKLCKDPNSGNISLSGYDGSRPTVIIWNRSNAHWVPIGVGPNAETVIPPNSSLRSYVDELLK